MATRSSLMTALAESSVHGISRAAAARSLPMRIMWTLLFLTFLTFCCWSAWTVVDKLRHITVQRSTQDDKVMFEFPDIYLCPSLFYSGSIPFTLKESEAKLVNDEVDRLSKLYDKFYCSGNKLICSDVFWRTGIIQQSLPVHILSRFLLNSRNQSFLRAPQILHRTTTPSPNSPTESVLLQPTNQICYLVSVPPEEHANLNYRRSFLTAWPFVDLFIEDFKYNGSEIWPITDPETEGSIRVEDWQFSDGFPFVQRLGFTLQAVPKGTYPSLMHNTQLGLAPGWSYDVLISMQDVVYSPNLHGEHCEPNQEVAIFKNPLTGGQQEFKSSRASCFFTRMSDKLVQKFNALSPDYPKPWKYRDIPGIWNLTELDMNNASVHETYATSGSIFTFVDEHSQEVDDYCTKRQPCKFKEYELPASSLKWPREGYGLATMLYFLDNEEFLKSRPATAQLVNLGKKLLAGGRNHSTHTETLFRHVVQKSMLELRIWVKTPRSPMVSIDYSYSWVAFLAELGGLLGLYIGCSVLTVCEVLELAYHLFADLIAAKLAKKDQPETEDALQMSLRPPDETC